MGNVVEGRWVLILMIKVMSRNMIVIAIKNNSHFTKISIPFILMTN